MRPYHSSRRWSPLFFALPALLFGATPEAADARDIEVEVIGEIPGPVEEVRATLMDLEGLGRWFPNTTEWDVLERSETEALVYGRLSLPWPLDDRDYVVRYVWADEEDEGFWLEAEAVQGRGPPPPDDVERVDEMRTLWELAPLGSHTRVRYVYTGSAGGFLPDWVFRIGWEMQTGIVMDALEEEILRRRAVGQGAAP